MCKGGRMTAVFFKVQLKIGIKGENDEIQSSYNKEL